MPLPNTGQVANVVLLTVVPHIFGVYCEFAAGEHRFGAIIEQAHEGLAPEYQVLVDQDVMVTVMDYTETTPSLMIVDLAA